MTYYCITAMFTHVRSGTALPPSPASGVSQATPATPDTIRRPSLESGGPGSAYSQLVGAMPSTGQPPFDQPVGAMPGQPSFAQPVGSMSGLPPGPGPFTQPVGAMPGHPSFAQSVSPMPGQPPFTQPVGSMPGQPQFAGSKPVGSMPGHLAYAQQVGAMHAQNVTPGSFAQPVGAMPAMPGTQTSAHQFTQPFAQQV